MRSLGGETRLPIFSSCTHIMQSLLWKSQVCWKSLTNTQRDAKDMKMTWKIIHCTFMAISCRGCKSREKLVCWDKVSGNFFPLIFILVEQKLYLDGYDYNYKGEVDKQGRCTGYGAAIWVNSDGEVGTSATFKCTWLNNKQHGYGKFSFSWKRNSSQIGVHTFSCDIDREGEFKSGLNFGKSTLYVRNKSGNGYFHLEN